MRFDLFDELTMQGMLYGTWAWRKRDNTVRYMSRAQGTCQELGAQQLKVTVDCEYICFSMKELNQGLHMATCSNPQGLILLNLKLALGYQMATPKSIKGRSSIL
jgi:hypothetical protein